MKSVQKKFFSSNIVYGIVLVLAIVFTVNASAKAWLIRGLMNVGLFQVSLPDKSKSNIVYSPDAVFKDGDGNEVSLSSLKGKVVFINFWATWCPPCIAEMPTINKLYKKLKNNKDIVFLMVDVDGKKNTSQEFMNKNKFDLPVYTSVGDIPFELLSGSIPTTDIINKEGKLMIRHEGAADYANPEVEKLLRELIEK